MTLTNSKSSNQIAALDPVELTQELVAINSVNPFKTHRDKSSELELGQGNEAEINLRIEELLKSLGFKVTRQLVQEKCDLTVDGQTVRLPERWNVLAEKGTGKHSILLFGHTDTVDVKDGWRTNPFTLTPVDVEGRTCLLYTSDAADE